MYWYSCLHVGRTMLYVEDRKLDLSFLETFYRISKIFYSWKISVMLNNSLFYSKSLNADRQNKWCCFDLMLPGKLEKVIDRQNIYNIYQPWPWRWWYQIWSGFCHKTLTFSNPPIMWRWFNHAGYILSQSLWSQNVAVFHWKT